MPKPQICQTPKLTGRIDVAINIQSTPTTQFRPNLPNIGKRDATIGYTTRGKTSSVSRVPHSLAATLVAKGTRYNEDGPIHANR